MYCIFLQDKTTRSYVYSSYVHQVFPAFKNVIRLLISWVKTLKCVSRNLLSRSVIISWYHHVFAAIKMSIVLIAHKRVIIVGKK